MSLETRVLLRCGKWKANTQQLRDVHTRAWNRILELERVLREEGLLRCLADSPFDRLVLRVKVRSPGAVVVNESPPEAFGLAGTRREGTRMSFGLSLAHGRLGCRTNTSNNTQGVEHQRPSTMSGDQVRQ